MFLLKANVHINVRCAKSRLIRRIIWPHICEHTVITIRQIAVFVASHSRVLTNYFIIWEFTPTKSRTFVTFAIRFSLQPANWTNTSNSIQIQNLINVTSVRSNSRSPIIWRLILRLTSIRIHTSATCARVRSRILTTLLCMFAYTLASILVDFCYLIFL